MAYTRRTCGKCGFRDIQPNMRQKRLYRFWYAVAVVLGLCYGFYIS